MTSTKQALKQVLQPLQSSLLTMMVFTHPHSLAHSTIASTFSIFTSSVWPDGPRMKPAVLPDCVYEVPAVSPHLVRSAHRSSAMGTLPAMQALPPQDLLGPHHVHVVEPVADLARRHVRHGLQSRVRAALHQHEGVQSGVGQPDQQRLQRGPVEALVLLQRHEPLHAAVYGDEDPRIARHPRRPYGRLQGHGQHLLGRRLQLLRATEHVEHHTFAAAQKVAHRVERR